MTATFYKPWNQVMHNTKFVKDLNKQQKYPKTTRINITDESKLQFYTEQTIDSGMFDKKDIINWEEKTKADKTWSQH